MQVYNVRVQFTGYHSRLVETKEFTFVASELRTNFIASSSMLGMAGFKVLAEWEDTVHQDWSEARSQLVAAATKPVR